MTDHGPGGSPQWVAPGAPPPEHRFTTVPQQGAAPEPGHPWEPARHGVYVGGPGTPPPPPRPFNPWVDSPYRRSGPVRVEPVPGTEFGLAYAPVPPVFSGLAIGSLVVGIGSIAVSLVVGCFGFIGGQDGWGLLVSGAFAILAGLLGLGGVGLGSVAVRQFKAARGRITGHGVAIAGIVCGGTGVLLTVGGMLVALLILNVGHPAPRF